MTKEQEVAAASELARLYRQVTGAPIIVTANQMKFFREAGVDCSNLKSAICAGYDS